MVSRSASVRDRLRAKRVLTEHIGRLAGGTVQAYTPQSPMPRAGNRQFDTLSRSFRVAAAAPRAHHSASAGTGICMKYSALTTGLPRLRPACWPACSSRSDVSLTGNTTFQYSHVFITTQEVWFNQNATAGADDAGWTKFTLGSPTTVDLVAATGGTLASITTGLRLLPGTYKQIRLIPLDASAALASSARTWVRSTTPRRTSSTAAAPHGSCRWSCSIPTGASPSPAR